LLIALDTHPTQHQRQIHHTQKEADCLLIALDTHPTQHQRQIHHTQKEADCLLIALDTQERQLDNQIKNLALMMALLFDHYHHRYCLLFGRVDPMPQHCP
jgi:hypothetical protein